ncbi:MAG: hypothetical protein JWL70_2190 [Acidimicrobiia bacterium]|nr:hypothetical protein [Acidimicrobiia bacterium]
MSADLASAEQAVRQYLAWLSNPDLLRDESRIAELRAKADAETDPIAKLRIYTELDRASVVDAEGVKLAFIHQAKTWADANDVTAGAFRLLGVEEVMLAAAGLVAGGRKRGRAPETSGRRAANVSATVIKERVASIDGPFTLSDLMNDIGGSPATVRKAVEEMIADGSVVKLGPVANHASRGRAPIQYQRA